MVDELTYSISATHTKNGKTTIIQAVNSVRSTGDAIAAAVQSIGHEAAVSLITGSVVTPAVMYVRNLGANYATILNDDVEIAIIRPGGQAIIDVSGVIDAADLKAQADTAAVLLDYTIFDEAT